MSAETSSWLNLNTLIGYTDKRGEAWHYRASEQGVEPNHYPLAIPVEDVRRRLFNFEVVKVPMTYTVNGVQYTAENRSVIARADTGADLGVFKNGYQPHGYNEWLVEEVEAILATSQDQLHIGSAGLLKAGAVAWVQFEFEETMETCGVQFRPFFTSASSLDGSLATTYNRGTQIVVCDNTLTGALGDKTFQHKIKHTAKSLGNVQSVRDALGILFETTEDTMAGIYQLANETVADKVWKAFLDSVAKVEPASSKRAQTMAGSKREALEALWASDPRVAPWAGTSYGVLAAMNTFQQHVQGVRNISRPERNMLNMVKGQFEKDDAQTLALLGEAKQRVLTFA